MNIEADLEKELMTYLKELTDNEQNSIRVFSAMYMNSYEKIKNEKIKSLDKSMTEQIKFYGGKKDHYLTKINEITEKYSNLIDEIINSYNTWFCAIISNLQKNQNNQKIAIVNEKISIGSEDEKKRIASEYKVNNYEIIIQECKKQAKDCKNNMENKLNGIFYNKDNGLSLGKVNFLQKIINIFTSKSKIEKFVIKSQEFEIEKLSEKINNEVQEIGKETINQIAIIEDAIMQTQNIFSNMLAE